MTASTNRGDGSHGAGAAVKRRARWNGEAWVQAPGLVVHSRKLRSPEENARLVSEMIVKHGLTDVIMIGERTGSDCVAKCYHWMIPSRRLWYAHKLIFEALHGRFPHDARDGGPI